MHLRQCKCYLSFKRLHKAGHGGARLQEACKNDYDGYTSVSLCLVLMQVMISYEQNANKIINCRQGERKSPDDLNAIIYEPIHSDDMVI